MAARKSAATKRRPCPICKGSREVSRAVRVGRKRRAVGEQTGICLTCWGTGQDPDQT